MTRLLGVAACHQRCQPLDTGTDPHVVFANKHQVTGYKTITLNWIIVFIAIHVACR